MSLSSLDRFPEIRDTVTNINDLFKQQMSARQVKKYEAALYLSATQLKGKKMLTDLQQKLLNGPKKDQALNQTKFDAGNALQTHIYAIKSADYKKALDLLSQMQDVVNDNTGSTAKAILKTTPKLETKAKNAPKPKTIEAAPKKVQATEEPAPSFKHVKGNLLGANKNQAQTLYNVIQYLRGNAA